MSGESDNDLARNVLAQTGLSLEGLHDSAKYIQLIRTGIPGSVVQSIIEALHIPRSVASGILKVDKSNVSRLYRQPQVSEIQSEAILDTARLLLKSIQIFGDQDRSTDWLKTPVPALGDAHPYELIDTFEGRKWIDRVLTQIEFGEFM